MNHEGKNFMDNSAELQSNTMRLSNDVF